MANVLPKEAIQSVWQGYRSRLILMGGLVLLATAALAFFALLPAYAVLKVEEGSQGKLAAVSPQPDTNLQARTERNDVTRARDLLVRVAPIVSATSSPTEAISNALALRPAGVTVGKISFASGKEGTISITGESKSRDGINAYRAALSKDGHFKSVSVPVGALVGGEGSTFTITLTFAI